MKRLGTFALIGALTFGSFVTADLVQTPTKAAAATETSDPFHDSWGFTKYSTLYEFGMKMNQYLDNQVRSSYQNTNWFTMMSEGTEHAPRTSQDIVKIFRKHSDGTLQRYKTIEPSISYKSDGQSVATWQTQFNNVYPPGEYVAIAYINGYHMFSKTFSVNK